MGFDYDRVRRYAYKPFAITLFALCIFTAAIFLYSFIDPMWTFRSCYHFWLLELLGVFLCLTLFPMLFYMCAGVRYITKNARVSSSLNMNRTKSPFAYDKIIKRILIVIFVLFLLCLTAGLITFFGFVVNWMVYTVPAQKGTFNVANLESGKVTIDRDEEDIIRISSQSLRDVAFGQGWAHCNERYYQMDLNRKIATGRFSELVGFEKGLRSDKFFRVLGFAQAAKNIFPMLNNETREALIAYTEGCNAYLDSKPTYTFEQRVHNYEYEKWTVYDSIAILKLYQWTQSGNFQNELNRYRLLTTKGLSAQRVKELDPPYPNDAFSSFTPQELDEPQETIEPNIAAENISIAMEEDHLAELEKILNTAKVTPGDDFDSTSIEDLINIWDPATETVGSPLTTGALGNGLLLKGAKITDGINAIMGISPTTALTAPNTWMLMALKYIPTAINESRVEGIGSSLPGVPGLLNGRTRLISWGAVPMLADVTDLFIINETVANEEYKHTVNGSLPYVKRTEEIKGLNGETYTFEVKETVFGPVLNDAYEEGQFPGKWPVALKWAAHTDDKTMNWVWKVWQTTDDKEFTTLAEENFQSPASMIMYADVYNFGVVLLAGKIPTRRQGHTGLFPLEGDGTYDWTGYVPQIRKHKFISQEWVAAAANRPVGRGFRFNYGYDFYEPFRAKRMYDLVDKLANESTSANTNHMIQFLSDQVSYMGLEFKKVLEKLPDSEAKQKLLEWDGSTKEGSYEAMLFKAWYWELSKVAQKETGLKYWNKPRYLLNIFTSGSDKACTDQGKTCTEYAAEALDKAWRENWGRGWSHEQVYRHILFDSNELRCVCSRSLSSGGASDTVFQTPESDPDKGYVSRQGPTYRQINNYVNRELPHSFGMPMGNSGHQFLKVQYDRYQTNFAQFKDIVMEFDDEIPITRTMVLQTPE